MNTSTDTVSVTDLLLYLEAGFNPKYLKSEDKALLDLALDDYWRKKYGVC